uniref:Uncharacterized protein n=1 Tax=Arundo donax TaxID=35708 RepID=A0A0A9GJ24_ARUDO
MSLPHKYQHENTNDINPYQFT